ncbi:LysM peptidoglycan-binding domain-containing protein [Alloscardovia venturai]|uniref:LysM peptidoglycan-binding domain-containing protein n=1 Tax=Alloscardovia venturai TaxID=1769421 RepID=A0ABW2Y4J9_9BIFI
MVDLMVEKSEQGSHNAECAPLYKSKWAALLAAVVTVIAVGAVFVMPHASAEVSYDSDNLVSYTVQPGDTLWSYAQRITPRDGDIYDTMDMIKQINHLNADNLEAGQSLLVPEA